MGTISTIRNRPVNPNAPHEDTIQDPSQMKRPVQVIEDNQIYERTEERYAKAIETFGVKCHLYRRKVQGRRCSCRDKEDIPADKCPVCYATGLVGGFDQYGHEKYTLDATSPLMTLSDVEVWDDIDPEPLRPVPVALERDPRGFMESGEEVHINGATAYDGFRIYSRLPKSYGGEVTPKFWDAVQSQWEPLTDFQAYLNTLGSPPWTLKTRFRIDFVNGSPDGVQPCFFYALHVKWKTGKDYMSIEQAAYTDVSKRLTDLGFVNAMAGIHWTANPRPEVLDTDFMIKIGTGERFKCTEPQKGDPGDRPLWQDLTMRPIQKDEILAEVF